MKVSSSGPLQKEGEGKSEHQVGCEAPRSRFGQVNDRCTEMRVCYLSNEKHIAYPAGIDVCGLAVAPPDREGVP